MSEKAKSGLSGYRGYEYQIVASIWVTLILMLDARRVTEVTIEPDNQEDLQAELVGTGSPLDQESSIVAASFGESIRHVFQMKTLSSSVWSVALLKDVIGDGASTQETGVESRRRPRALQLLLKDRSLSYTLVTDAKVKPQLSTLARDNVLLERDDTELPTELLKGGTPDSVSSLRGRLHIISGSNAELLQYRIRELLTQKGGVPHSRVVSCIDDLTQVFRQCLLGERNTRFTLTELESTLSRYGARPVATPGPWYVPPVVAEQASSILRSQGCAVIVGPSDIGKASLADHLASTFKLGDLACPSIRVNRLDELAGRLREEGPALIVARDGWADSDGRREPANLSAMLANALGDKYVIVTSDLDVFQRLPPHMRTSLARFVVTLNAEHYDESARWQIVLNEAGLSGWQLESLNASRAVVLRELAEPFPLRFFGTLVRNHAESMIQPAILDGEEMPPFDFRQAGPNEDFFSELAERALRETEGHRVEGLILAYPNAPLQHAALVLGIHVMQGQGGVLWLKDALPAMERIAESVATMRALHLQVDSYIEHLVKTGVVQRWEDKRLTFEAGSIDALCRVITDGISEVHRVLAAVASEFVQAMGPGNFSVHLRRIVTLLQLTYGDASPRSNAWTDVVTAIDAQLVRALSGQDRVESENNVQAAMEWGWGMSALARLLYTMHPKRVPFVENSDFWFSSHDAWSAVTRLQPDFNLRRFVRRYLIGFMPYTWIDYSAASEQFASFFRASGLVLGEDVYHAVHALEQHSSTGGRGDDRWTYEDGNHNKRPLLALLAAVSERPFVSRLRPPTPSWDL
ncbi:nSTAND3 domain-containing NTPase [Paraburkholderia caribensis]|uniref:nSTAND3 domain-containing NTPase n=1 Tax=Paraburkholderia caribensis TaxID=75105 RepID=UPI0007223342|nr:hypothetical protein [Paraburkholderia caribensis]ALP65211.1 hypothetical protein AN416_21695 [Paraburkholderia caribensis]AUT53635.1 hypothetical protein C2L66_16800 [Paraburkholderia caribensis]